MTSYKRKNRARLFTAITLIAGSFLSAFILSSLANRTQLMWGARAPLTPGHVISSTDIEARRVALPDGDSTYLSVQRQLEGSVVLRSIGIGELVPAVAISRNFQALRTSSLPISVHGSDIPSDLHAGEVVNLYHVGDSRLTQEIGPPRILLSHIYILGIDRKGQNLGGDLSLTLSVNVKNVLDVLGATAAGRIVVVRVNG
jgi:hypothetical protein